MIGKILGKTFGLGGRLFGNKYGMGLAVGAAYFGGSYNANLSGVSTSYEQSEDPVSPINRAAFDTTSGLLGSSALAIPVFIGLDIASNIASKKAIRGYYSDINKSKAAGVMLPKIGIRSKRITDKIFSSSRRTAFLKTLSKSQLHSSAGIAKTALKLSKYSLWGNLASAAIMGAQVGFESMNLPNPSRPTMQPRRPNLGGTFNDSEEAYTQRQRALRAIQTSQYSGRSALGNEASLMHNG